jgi:hypothetical protein
MTSTWQSRQLVVTPELLGMRSIGECKQRVEKLGLTPLPCLPYRQEHWRLDVLLTWSRANGLDRLPSLAPVSAQRRPPGRWPVRVPAATSVPAQDSVLSQE